MKLIRLVWFICIPLTFSCKDNGPSEIYGNWAVHDVFYGEEDISGIDKNARVYMTLSMTIDEEFNIISLPTRLSNDEGKISFFKTEGRDWMRIYDATDSRFNGDYLIKLYKIPSKGNPNTQHYELVLDSKSVYIYGEKYVGKL